MIFKTSIAPASDGIAPKTRRIQTAYIQNLKRDDGTTKNIRLIDKEHIHNNRLQVINQYAVADGADAGLCEYVQIFVISNGTNTKYYSNTTRASHIREMDAAGRKASKKTSNSFEFTSYWADAGNRLITDLMDFGRTFLARHTLRQAQPH